MKRLIGIAALIMVPVFALAQSFPSKPVRMIVGYAAGGGADVLARLLAPKLADALGQAVTVDNRPGAGSTVAAATLAKAPADGHTIYFSDAGFVTAPAIFRELPYDPIAGFAPIAELWQRRERFETWSQFVLQELVQSM